MTNHQQYLTVLLLTSALQAPAVNADPAPVFHFEAPLSEGKASLRRAELPWEVLSGLMQARQADLRVYNADDQIVPFTVRTMAATLKEKQVSQPLDFFSGDDPARLNNMLVMEAGLGVTQIAQLQQAARHYLIIPNREQQGQYPPLQALELHWQALQQWLPKSLVVETSNDLLHWRRVGFASLPYVLRERGVVLENHQLKLEQPVSSRFIRLSGQQDFAPLLPALQRITGHYKNHNAPAAAQRWQPVELSEGDQPQTYRYNPPLAVPLKQWRLALPEPGYLYEGAVYTRPAITPTARQKAKALPPWRHTSDFQHYFLTTQAGAVRSAPTPATGLSGQQWQLRFKQPLAPGITPRIELNWQPLELYFIAQGNGPFRIKYGSNTAKAIPGMRLDKQLMTAGVENVKTGPVVQLAALKPDQASTNRLTWLLWSVLGGSVLFLLWMAKRLWKDMSV